MPSEKMKNNFLFIMTDQHRFDYMGCAGADFLRTPNLDRIARMGMRFTNCFTNAPVCVPARIGLASGLQPLRIGSVDNASYLPRSVTTYYQRLRDYGYRTACVGKLDLAKPNKYNGLTGDRPCVYGWGFTDPLEIEGKNHAMVDSPIGPYTHHLHEKGLLESFAGSRKGTTWYERNCYNSVLPTEDFHDSFIGRKAAEWIETVSDDFPWHLFVSFAGPHSQFDPPAEFAKKYDGAIMPPSIDDDMEGKPKWQKIRKERRELDAERVAEIRRKYCAVIELIDHQVGLILNALEKRGMIKNTYIFFVSDHGEMLGDHGMYSKGIAYEPSFHVPLLAAGPVIMQGKTCDAMVELIDLNPTICELAGLPAQENIDARSFVPVLKGQLMEHRYDVVCALRNFRCIRTSKYKYIENYNDLDELYDLDKDPFELVNIATDKKELCKQLKKQLENRFMEGKWRGGGL